ncbi:hypothetical protein ACFLZ8_02435 [Planctomycetota bacterium]
MSTKAQINANRSNAQKSTGPKSAEGKAAVAKNALKHGLFALQTVISGESQQQYELFRAALLSELAPAGAVETMLAERAVSLSWRLKRIENIQNQVIGAMIERDLASKEIEKLIPQNLRQKKSEHLALGYVAIKDYANSRVLERLLMYERRIENSLFRTTKELRKLKIIKQIEENSSSQPLFTAQAGDSLQPEDETRESAKLTPEVSENHSVANSEKHPASFSASPGKENEKQSQFVNSGIGFEQRQGTKSRKKEIVFS